MEILYKAIVVYVGMIVAAVLGAAVVLGLHEIFCANKNRK